ncbi:metallophosphoesterase [Streptomyces sp. IBSNAI002]|uniref:metallophosphoesterase n=1 Tax=Streptomyces sp. IBSNAI002 TaxID=3457500 RepID=UPI003FD30E73
MQQLIATGCFHSNVPEGNGMLAVLRERRQAGALVVDAGDFFGGSAFHEFSGGRIEERILREHYDAVVPGNHDLADLMNLARPDLFPPVICANLRPPPAFRGQWESGLVLHGRELDIGIVGYLGRQAFEAIPASERAGFAYVEPTAGLIAAERDRLLEAGADLVVGVSHSGFAHDITDQARDWPLTVVVAGHCHSPSSHWFSHGRHVAKAPETGMGLLRLGLDRAGAHRVTIDTFNCDAEPAEGLANDVAAFRQWGSDRVGTLPVPLPDRERAARALVRQALRDTRAGTFLVNTFSLRTGLPTQVLRSDLLNCAPFDSDIVVLDGLHDPQALAGRAVELGEGVTSAPDTPPAELAVVATTRYLADRLGLACRPSDPPCTLRGILTRLTEETSP